MVHCYFLHIATQAFVFNDFNFAYAVSRARTLIVENVPHPGAARNLVKTITRAHFKSQKNALCRRYGSCGYYLASPVSDVVHNVITESISNDDLFN